MEKSRAMAITSFGFGLTFWIPLLNLIFGLLAIYLGIKALRSIKSSPDKYGGKWFAITGIVLGTIPIILSLTGVGMCLGGYKEICENMGLLFLV